jgi:hypothetical protein
VKHEQVTPLALEQGIVDNAIERRGRTRRSALLIGLMLIVSSASFGLLRGFAALRPAGRARITDSDGNSYEMPLDRDGHLEVRTSLGRNLVAVRDGRVFVEEADCPGLDCVHHAPIDASGQTIVCLPHRLVIEVQEDKPLEDGADINEPDTSGADINEPDTSGADINEPDTNGAHPLETDTLSQ